MEEPSTEPTVNSLPFTAAARRAGATAKSVPWGPCGWLELRLPSSGPFAGSEVEEFSPDLSNPLGDYPAALEKALDRPAAGVRLEQLLSPGARVAIVVDDPSRWTPLPEALPIVLGRLQRAGVAPEHITISLGIGRHAAVDALEIQRRLGEDIAARYRCFSPPVDDLAAYADLGSTPQGVPVRVFRPVAEADLRILIGSVLPHLQAGFGGGYKLIFPGTSHRSTLGALHRQGLDDPSAAAGLLGEDAACNPMRRAIHAAAERLGPCWSISHSIGGSGQVFSVIAGPPEPVQDLVAADVRRRFQAPLTRPADLIVAANHPWPGDPMQSFKALLHHRAASRPGGVLAGIFWTDPAQIDRSFPIAALGQIAATGACGGWTIRRLLPLAQRIAAASNSPAAFMLHWARELVVDRTVLVYAPPLCERIGTRLGPVRLFADQAKLWEAAANALARTRRAGVVQPVRVRVFPHGGLTYVATPQQRL
jgi:nickel-dependent lactate racemase